MPEDLRTIRRKIRTTTSVSQITRAMKMVSAARLRRTQQLVEKSRPYWEGIRRLVRYVAGSSDGLKHPLLSAEEPTNAALILVAGDRGLCGSYNSLVFRRALQALHELPVKVNMLVGVGQRVAAWAKTVGLPLYDLFPAYGGQASDQTYLTVARAVRSYLSQGLCDGVYAVYAPYVSSLQNIPDCRRLVPMECDEIPGREQVQYLFEPDPAELLDALLVRAVEVEVSQVVIEGAASEQAARVAAMTAASDNADEMMEELVRLRNRIRQQQITTEILEIVSGADAITAE